MTKLFRNLFVVITLSIVASCGTTAVITDLEEDKVKVQAHGSDLSVIDAEAAGGCAMHERRPRRISYNCLDFYCTKKEYLYACLKN